MLIIYLQQILPRTSTDVLRPCQTSKMELFAQVVLAVWHGSEHNSDKCEPIALEKRQM